MTDTEAPLLLKEEEKQRFLKGMYRVGRRALLTVVGAKLGWEAAEFLYSSSYVGIDNYVSAMRGYMQEEAIKTLSCISGAVIAPTLDAIITKLYNKK